MGGVVEAIFVAEQAGQPMRSVDAVTGEAGRGLIGDRHYRPLKVGAPRPENEPGEVSLVEAEVLESLLAEYDVVLEGQETRRNVVTRGVRLNDLIGRRFRLGGLLCEGTEVCQPCAHMQRKVGKPILKPLVHRGGLRARIVESGTMRVGDAIAPVEAPALA